MTATPISEAASVMAGQRVREQKVCAICGTEFVGLVTARTCSNRCRQQLWRNEKKAQRT